MMNDLAVRTEEQIISLFPDRETLICRGWVLKKMEGRLLVYPLYYKSSRGDILDNVSRCEEAGLRCGMECVFRIVEYTNYHLSSILSDNGYGPGKCGVMGEWNRAEDAGELRVEGKRPGRLSFRSENSGETGYVTAGEGRVIGIKHRELLFLPEGIAPGVEWEDILRFGAVYGIARILADIPGREELPEEYRRAGFRRAYLYRCYQKDREEKSSRKQED